MLENLGLAPRWALAVSRASFRAYARRTSAHTHAAPARDTARDDIQRDNESVCIRKMSARAFASCALPRLAMLHLIQ